MCVGPAALAGTRVPGSCLWGATHGSSAPDWWGPAPPLSAWHPASGSQLVGPRRWNQRGPTQPPVCRNKGDVRRALCTARDPGPWTKHSRARAQENPGCPGGVGATQRVRPGRPTPGSQRPGGEERPAHHRWPGSCCPVRGQPGAARPVGRTAENEACGLCGHCWAHAVANARGSLSWNRFPTPRRPRPHSRARPSGSGCSWGPALFT